MRLIVQDFSGHPFQAQLSRELARRGHEVWHVHCPDYSSGHGAVECAPDDPDTLRFVPVPLGAPFAKYRGGTRLVQELRYARAVGEVVREVRPDVVLSSNDPLLSKWWLRRLLRRARVPSVFWLQDLYSVAFSRHAVERLGVVGRPVGAAARALERSLLRSSAHVVAITQDFGDQLARWHVPRSSVTVIENWAPLGELPVVPKQNSWRARLPGDPEVVFLYAGTLGLKHDPGLLRVLADEAVKHEPRAVVVVVSSGAAADRLEDEAGRRHLDALVVLPFQPWDVMPEVLGASDVLVALLEPDAGTFSVPSKVLTYHCAGRPVLAIVPRVNAAARMVSEAGSGWLADPDESAVRRAVAEILGHREEWEQRGLAARRLAESRFAIADIGDAFERVLERAGGR